MTTFNPSLFKAIVERCAWNPLEWAKDSPELSSGSQYENERLLPIIRELLAIVEEQQKALEYYGDLRYFPQIDRWASGGNPDKARSVNAVTLERLATLAGKG